MSLFAFGNLTADDIDRYMSALHVGAGQPVAPAPACADAASEPAAASVDGSPIRLSNASPKPSDAPTAHGRGPARPAGRRAVGRVWARRRDREIHRHRPC